MLPVTRLNYQSYGGYEAKEVFEYLFLAEKDKGVFMDWHDALSGEGLKKWLIAISSGARITQGQPLDPFATSMRVLKQTSEWLLNIQENGELVEGTQRRNDQAIIDMISAGLIERGETISLTTLGSKTFDNWVSYEVANNDDEDELPRCLILLENAI